MRKDLQKLLCEQERNGSSRSFKEVRRKKDFHLDANEFSAGRESMKKRYVISDINKSFSENFNPLWGVIRKNAGRKWDDVFSELNEVFDMRNHVNAHILIHLWQFVERNTFVRDGEVWIHGRFDAQPLESARCEYYVHPISGKLLKNEKYKSYKQANRERAEERKAEERKTRIVIEEGKLELRRKDVGSPWFMCAIRFLSIPKPTYEWVEHGPYRDGGKIYRYFSPKYPVITAYDAWTEKRVDRYGVHYCTGYRSANKKELKKYGAPR